MQMLSTYMNDEQIDSARKQARTGRPFRASAQLAKRIDGLFKLNDANGDGRISAAEARPVVKSNFQTFDADGDGYVDRFEFDQNAAKFIGPPQASRARRGRSSQTGQRRDPR